MDMVVVVEWGEDGRVFLLLVGWVVVVVVLPKILFLWIVVVENNRRSFGNELENARDVVVDSVAAAAR